jgi:preprotein translocase subunit SecE
MMQRILKFFRNVAIEMQKVSWPRKKELYKYTVTVVTTVLFFIIFFTIIDLGITYLIELIP